MKWTEIEIKILKENIHLTYLEISLILNRSIKSIKYKIRKIGLQKTYSKYNEFNGKYKNPYKEKLRCDKISKSCKINKKSGGLRKGSGRGKKGTYLGYWCDSSYELAWVIYNIDHNIKFERNTEKFEYFIDNNLHYYIPDFKIGNIFYEIKGYEDYKLKYKLKYFNKDIKVLYKDDLEEIFKYVKNKYGDDYIKLYEDITYNNCIGCKKILNRRNKKNICMSCIINNKKNKGEKIYKKRVDKKCNCGKAISNRNNNCKKCYDISQRKIKNRPNINKLLYDVKEMGYTKTGKKYGVSDNTIRKWINK